MKEKINKLKTKEFTQPLPKKAIVHVRYLMCLTLNSFRYENDT